MSKAFGQASHLLRLADEADMTQERFEALHRSGILADVLGTVDPSIVDRDSLRKVLAGLRVEIKGFPVWKSLTIGGVSRDELAKKLADGGHRVSDYAKAIMEKPAFKIVRNKTTVNLVRVTVRELGFTSGPTFAEICERAKQHDLELCPAECGPHLRLSYTDQPMDEWNWIAMEPIAGSGGSPSLFGVGRGSGGSWLRTSWFVAEDRFCLDGRLVFVSRK